MVILTSSYMVLKLQVCREVPFSLKLGWKLTKWSSGLYEQVWKAKCNTLIMLPIFQTCNIQLLLRRMAFTHVSLVCTNRWDVDNENFYESFTCYSDSCLTLKSLRKVHTWHASIQLWMHGGSWESTRETNNFPTLFCISLFNNFFIQFIYQIYTYLVWTCYVCVKSFIKYNVYVRKCPES